MGAIYGEKKLKTETGFQIERERDRDRGIEKLRQSRKRREGRRWRKRGKKSSPR